MINESLATGIHFFIITGSLARRDPRCLCWYFYGEQLKLDEMDWYDFILSALGGSVLGGIGSIFYFKPKLKEARAEASKAEVEASSAEYAHLLERINSMEKMYTEQGATIDALRKEQMELAAAKYESDKKVLKLEKEVQDLRQKNEALTKDLEAYKVLMRDKQ